MIIVLLNAAHKLRDPCTQVKPQEWYDGKKLKPGLFQTAVYLQTCNWPMTT